METPTTTQQKPKLLQLKTRPDHEIFIESMKQLSADLQFHHWNTISYAEHKALNRTYDDFDGVVDGITEKLIGKLGRIKIVKTITPSCDLKDLPDCLITCGKELRQLGTKHDMTDLVNISDEIVGIGNQLRYLLTLV